MNDRDRDAWFAPKRYGYGAGLPLRWQGWLTLAGVIAVILGFAYIVPLMQGIAAALSAITFLTALAVLLRITALRTRGGWRWRWGERE